MEDIDVAFTHSVNRGLSDDAQEGDKSDKDGDGAAGKDGPGGPSGLGGTSPGVTLSGLLGAIDGVAAQEGRILFATTNRYSVLDPALIRPGRLDLHIEFNLATSWQAREIFKCFYPAHHESSDSEKSVSLPNGTSTPSPESDSTTLHKRHPLPKMTEAERDALAETFASAIPDRLTSMAAIQGHLMNFKTRPYQAVEHAGDFVRKERERKVRKEKEVKTKQADASGAKTPSDDGEMIKKEDAVVGDSGEVKA